MGLVGRILLPPPGPSASRWRIRDFASDADGFLYLLETVFGEEEPYESVRKVAPDGNVVWSIQTGQPAGGESGTFHRLLTDGNARVYLVLGARGDVASVGRDGSLDLYARWPGATGPVFMDHRGRLYAVRYETGSGRRRWVAYDPGREREYASDVDPAAYAALAAPIGVGARGEAYAVEARTLYCLSPEGLIQWTKTLGSLVAEPERIDLGHYSDGAFSVEIWGRDGRQVDRRRLSIPAQLQQSYDAWRLIARGPDGALSLLGTPASEGNPVVVTFSAAGEVVDRSPAPADLRPIEHRLQEPSTWAVDQRGAVHLPIITPERFLIAILEAAREGAEAEPGG